MQMIAIDGSDKNSWRIRVDAPNGLSLRMRQLTEQDVSEDYVAWMRDPMVNRFLESRFVEHSVESISRFVSGCYQSTDNLLLGVFVADDVHIGNIKLGNIHPHHASADLGLLIGDRGYWGKGVATAAIAGVTELARENLLLNKVVAGAYATNIGSIQAFLKNGYVQAGSWTRHVLLPDGTYDDIILLQRLFHRS